MTERSSPDVELANSIDMCLQTGVDPKLTNAGWSKVTAALRARSSAGNEQTLRFALQRIADSRNNKNWRKPEICDEAERALSQRDLAQPSCGRAGGKCECTSIDECARAFAQANQE